MTFDIRPLTNKDAHALRALRLHGLKTEPHAFGASYETESEQPLSFFENRCIATDSNILLGAFLDNHLVGLTNIVRESALKSNHFANIFAVYTHPEYRGKGVSQGLLNYAIDITRAWHGVEFIKLAVSAINHTAVHIYEKVGFIKYGTLPSALKIKDQYYDEHLMVLSLRSNSS